jgi:hypothetical protein
VHVQQRSGSGDLHILLKHHIKLPNLLAAHRLRLLLDLFVKRLLGLVVLRALAICSCGGCLILVLELQILLLLTLAPLLLPWCFGLLSLETLVFFNTHTASVIFLLLFLHLLLFLLPLPFLLLISLDSLAFVIFGRAFASSSKGFRVDKDCS